MKKYLLLVFLGACSYGILSTLLKLAYRDGYTVGEVLISQYFFGWLMLLVLMLSFSGGQIKLPFRQWLLLCLVGTSTGLTGLFYGIALQTIPASISIILLFQFTWIGIFFEALDKKAFPGLIKFAATALLLSGTVLASGLIGSHISGLNSRGILFGLLSAVTYAFFIFASGKAAAGTPALTRAFHMTTGSVVLLLCLFPPSLSFGSSMVHGLWKYGLTLGLFGIAIPIFFLSVGVPRVGTGISSILSAAELPVVVVMSVLILKERVTIFQWVGVVIILLGIAVPQINRQRNTVQEPEQKNTP